jgi:predicted nucleic acid-binding OB-fold protein
MASKINDREEFDRLLNTSQAKDFLFRAEHEMFPKLQSSMMSLVLGSSQPDAKLALEIGAAILFDKPLVVMVPKGKKISAGLLRAAHEVIEYDDLDENASKKIRDAVTRILEEQKKKEGSAGGKE